VGASTPGSFARPIGAGSSRAFGSMIWAFAPSSVQFGELKASPEPAAETHAEARRTRRERLPRRRVRVRGLHRAWLSLRGGRGVGFPCEDQWGYPQFAFCSGNFGNEIGYLATLV